MLVLCYEGSYRNVSTPIESMSILRSNGSAQLSIRLVLIVNKALGLVLGLQLVDMGWDYNGID